MKDTFRIELRLLLPEVEDERDACVARLTDRLGQEPGLMRGHVVSRKGEPAYLCLHYDPNVITLAEVGRLARAAGAEIHDQFAHSILKIRAISSEDSSATIESALRAVPGVIRASVNLPAQNVYVEFERHQTSEKTLQGVLDALGFSVDASDGRGEFHASWYNRNKEFIWSLAAGATLMIAWVGETWLGWSHMLAVGLYLVSYWFGGYDLIVHLFQALRRGHFRFGIDLLMLLAAVGAAILGEWVEGAFLLFLFSLAHALEHYALGRARHAIQALSSLAPARAWVRRDGKEIEVLVDQVQVGETVIVHPAQSIPVDGQVQSGQSAVDQSPITGESIPVNKSSGDEVFAGTVNGLGALEIVTTRTVGDRTLDRVVRLVEEAQTRKAPTQQLTDRFEKIFVPLVLLSAFLLIVGPPIFRIWTWDMSFYRGMALLVAASPCALALGTPSAVLAGIAQAARNGVLIKGGEYLEALGGVKAIAFDKTGTLTMGKPQVTDLLTMPGVSPSDLLKIAAAVERRSQHPLAAAVVLRAETDGIQIPDVTDVTSITASGVRAKIEEIAVEIGNMRLFEGSEIPEAIVKMTEDLRLRGRSSMVVRYGREWLGVIGLADSPRPNVRRTLEQLRHMGIRTLVMLSGDNAGAANNIGREVGIDQVRAGLLPEDKVTAVRELLSLHGSVAMVGDGVNDAPSLASATVGIAMGGAGVAAALETADVALMGDDLAKLPFVVGLSRSARRIIRQNLVIALGTIIVLAAATTAGLARIGPAVIFHEGSTLLVIFNSLRLLGYRGENEADAKDTSGASPAKARFLI